LARNKNVFTFKGIPNCEVQWKLFSSPDRFRAGLRGKFLQKMGCEIFSKNNRAVESLAGKSERFSAEGRLPVVIGIVVHGSESDQVHEQARKLADSLHGSLQTDLPQFHWVFRLLIRHDFPTEQPQDPLALLEFGSDIKIENGFDFLLVLTSAPLVARFDQAVSGVPSSMLETGVLSIARQLDLEKPEVIQSAVLGLARHILGHLFDLDHNDDSVMRPREFWNDSEPLDWSDEEKKKIGEFLQDIADPRLEETAGAGKTQWKFYCQVLMRDGFSLARDILLFRSWRMMLHLGRFTAATAISVIFLFLSAEAWELGAAIKTDWLNLVLAGVLLLSTFSLYFGQNLQAVGRSDKMMEQAVRSRIILFGTLLVGMCSFWINLFLISLAAIYLMPENVLAGWTGLGDTSLPMAHFARLMATFGILASALGGNLEEERDLKAVLIYTEET
jgi:hypothetical protein